MNVFFADSANGNSILDGRHNILFYTTSLQYDSSTRRLYSSTGAFSGYNHQFGNYLWLQGTGWTDGLYMVKQKIDSNYIELETWDSSLSYGDSGYLATIPGVLPAADEWGNHHGTQHRFRAERYDRKRYQPDDSECRERPARDRDVHGQGNAERPGHGQ